MIFNKSISGLKNYQLYNYHFYIRKIYTLIVNELFFPIPFTLIVFRKKLFLFILILTKLNRTGFLRNFI